MNSASSSPVSRLSVRWLIKNSPLRRPARLQRGRQQRHRPRTRPAEHKVQRPLCNRSRRVRRRAAASDLSCRFWCSARVVRRAVPVNRFFFLLQHNVNTLHFFAPSSSVRESPLVNRVSLSCLRMLDDRLSLDQITSKRTRKKFRRRKLDAIDLFARFFRRDALPPILYTDPVRTLCVCVCVCVCLFSLCRSSCNRSFYHTLQIRSTSSS